MASGLNLAPIPPQVLIYTYVTHEHSHEIHVPNFLKPFPLPVSPFIIIYFISIILYLNS